MTLLRAADLHLSFGSRTVFDELTLVIEEGERVGLIGVNGSGKSSLMKILSGEMTADRGEIQLRRGTRVSYLGQEPVFPAGATVASELTTAHAPLREAESAHAELSARIAAAPGDARLLEQLSALAARIEHLGGWDTAHQARTLLDRLGVREWERPVAELSGGTRKRVALARGLLSRPDLLLLDEPTNHLDADTVDWLEEELDAFPGALLLVTHDRYFLDDLVDRIVEIAPGRGLTSYPGNYQAYLEQKLTADAEAKVAGHKRDRWIAQELAWLGRGVEARRTKNKARIQRAQKLLGERVSAAPRAAGLALAAAPRLGRTVIEAEHVHKSFGERAVLRDASFILQKGERIGIVGPNGVGKTTFLRVVLGELEPDSGQVVIGKNTRVAYYDQERAQLDPEKTVLAAASDADPVEIGGRRVALRDYLDDLLFPVPMQRMQVKALSGGERNRLLLARLFLQGANVLVLDEPTNDLDIVTLNVLEELLLGFDGSVLLVTHDRYFLDKVATSILAFEGAGRVTRYPGNYESYLGLRPPPAQALAPARKQAAPSAAAPKPKKLTFKERLELEAMDERVQAAEAKKSALEAALSDPATYAAGPQRVPALKAELETATAEVEALYARWQALEDLAEK